MTANTSLSFYSLTLVDDSPDVIIGRKDINSYATFPPEGAELLKQLQAGHSLEEVARWYEERYGETVDLTDFLETLSDLHFIREGETAEAPIPVDRFAALWQRLGRAAFSPLAWLLYVGICSYAFFLLLRMPVLLPNYRNFFFTPYLVIMELGLFLGQIPGILFHELFHVLAGRRLGIPSSLSLGRRLYFLVFETNLDGLWSVPRRLRYLPFLAGMLGDLLWFSLMTIIASLSVTPTNPYAFPGAFCLGLALETVLRFCWQFYFYLQTDIYYVFTNILRCVDLQQTTRQYFWNRVYRILGRPAKIQDEEQWYYRDRQVARWYVYFFVAGYLFSLGAIFLVGIPTAIRVFSNVVSHLFQHAVLGASFWDACVFLALNALQLIIIAAIWWRDFQARRRARALSVEETATQAS